MSYNKSNIGEFGYAVYLTNGSNTKYIGWTDKTSYTVNLNEYAGYNGAIVKSTYSIFKSNASSGTSVSFYGENNTDNPSGSDESNSNDYSISVNGKTGSIKKGSTYNELGTSSIESIKYKGENIKSQVSNLQVSATSAKKVAGNSVSINNITDEKILKVENASFIPYKTSKYLIDNEKVVNIQNYLVKSTLNENNKFTCDYYFKIYNMSSFENDNYKVKTMQNADDCKTIPENVDKKLIIDEYFELHFFENGNGKYKLISIKN